MYDTVGCMHDTHMSEMCLTHVSYILVAGGSMPPADDIWAKWDPDNKWCDEDPHRSTYIHAHMHAFVNKHMHTCTNTHKSIYTQKYIRSHTHTHAYIRKQAHAHMH